MKDINLKGLKVGVLKGGVSNEREISLISGREAASALRRKGIDAVEIDIVSSGKEEVIDLISRSDIDLAFVALHGAFGEDGAVQMILEDLGIPYTGSGPGANRLAMDKVSSKKIFIKNKIPTPGFVVLDKYSSIKNKGFPKVVKPHFAGSSLGVSIVDNDRQLQQAIERAFLVSQRVIIEDYIEGKELTVGILGLRPLSVVEIIPLKPYYDFTAKYTEGMASFVAPASLEKTLYEKIMTLALSSHIALGCSGFSRVDIRLSLQNTPFILELNSIPGLTSHSLLPLSAKAVGIGFDELIMRMAQLALTDRAKKKTVTELI